MFCSKCGKVLRINDSFCGFCGNQVARVDEQWWESLLTKAQKYRIYAMLLAIALVVIYGLSFLSVNLSCARGYYDWAYKIASERRKDDVIAENLIAVQSAYCVDVLKKPESFVLKDAYYDDTHIVLLIEAQNSYNDSTEECWYFGWDDEKDEWFFGASYTSLEEEKIYSYEDFDSAAKKLAKNIYLVHTKNTIGNGHKLDEDAVERINKLHKKEKLEKVELIDVD